MKPFDSVLPVTCFASTLLVPNVQYVIPVDVNLDSTIDLRQEMFEESRTNFSLPVFFDVKLPLVSRLCSFSDLDENWNGEHSISPNHSTISNAINFLDNLDVRLVQELLKEESITPTSHGTIVIDFENSRGEYLNIEIGESLFSAYSVTTILKSDVDIEREVFIFNFIPDEILTVLKAIA